MAPESLVCPRCWQDFFNTTSYQTLCQHSYVVGTHINPSTEQIASAQQILDSAARGCQWCLFLQWLIGSSEQFQNTDGPYEIRISRTIVGGCTPTTRDAFYLNISPLPGTAKFHGWALRLHFYADEFDEAASVVMSRQLQMEVNSQPAQHQIAQWIRECSSHDQCKDLTEGTAPARLIEIEPAQLPSVPRLICVDGKPRKYAALSYCWGSDFKGLLNSSNLEHYMTGIDLEELPQAFRDAFEVAKTASIPYIWIDALCIIQNSEQDKLREIPKMQQIYEESFVTVVAANSSRATNSFLKARPIPRDIFQIPFWVDTNHFGSIHVQDLDKVEYDETAEFIAERAWTLQEQLVSPRLLIYASHTLQWCCSVGVQNLGNSTHYAPASEDRRPNGTIAFLRRLSNTQWESFTKWLKTVEVYTQRRSTFSSDKLVALSAVARQFSESLGPDYIAGLWQFRFLEQLLWTTYSSHHEDDNKDTNTQPYRAPSWSWASTDSRVRFDSLSYDEDASELSQFEPFKCEICQYETLLKSSAAPYGEVLGSTLTMKAVLRCAWFLPIPGLIIWQVDEGDTMLDLGLATAQTKFLESWRREHPDSHDDSPLTDKYTPDVVKAQYDVPISKDLPATLVYCLPLVMASWSSLVKGILLEKSQDSLSFTRIGSFEQAQVHDFETCQQTTITII